MNMNGKRLKKSKIEEFYTMPEVKSFEVNYEITEFPIPRMTKDILEEFKSFSKSINRKGPTSLCDEPLYPSEKILIDNLSRNPTIKEKMKDYLVDKGIYYKYFFKWQPFKRSVKMEVEHLVHKYFHNDECGCS